MFTEYMEVNCLQYRRFISDISHDRQIKPAQKFNSLYMLEKIIPVKAIPLQAWAGPGGSRKLRLPDCRTFGT